MILHFTESLPFHFLNLGGLSRINSNPPLKKERSVGGGVSVVRGIKAEEIKDVRAKVEDLTEQKLEFATPSSVLRFLQLLFDHR